MTYDPGTKGGLVLQLGADLDRGGVQGTVDVHHPHHAAGLMLGHPAHLHAQMQPGPMQQRADPLLTQHVVFTPRRRPGTTSARNLAIADRLEAEGLLTDAGRRALGRGAAATRRPARRGMLSP